MTNKNNTAENNHKTTVTPLDDTPDWTFDLLEQYQYEIARVADFYRLDTYTNQIEVITAEQMMDAYASVGMPIGYSHWTFGKKFIQTEQNYKRGQMGLAYEIVINSSPCISYLMEENTLTMQATIYLNRGPTLALLLIICYSQKTISLSVSKNTVLVR